MKFHDPKYLALLNAVIATVMSGFLFYVSVFLLFDTGLFHWKIFLTFTLSGIIIFSVTFLLFHYTIDRFIYSKIRLIYKSIHSVKTAKENKQRYRADDNLLEHVQEEVEQWKTEKSDEIERLTQLEQYRRDFIGNVSHELKTPLFNIQGYVSTLLDGGLKDRTINRDYLKRTEKSVERLIRIVNDLDEIAQLESGQLKLNVTRFDIVTLCHEVVEMLELKATKKDLQLIIQEPDKAIWVEGDREKIRQVLTNIVDNSIRYSNHKNKKTKISFFDMDVHILTEVTDNGIGIDQEDLPRVFERFYRTERGRATTRKGKGLGLAIVKHIVEAHQQTVHVRSAIGVGTTFGFTLKKA